MTKAIVVDAAMSVQAKLQARGPRAVVLEVQQFWNDADRRRCQSIDAWIREHLASTGRDGFTAQEIRDIELQLRTTLMSNAEIAERMRAVRLWRVPAKSSPSQQAALRQTITGSDLLDAAGHRASRARRRKHVPNHVPNSAIPTPTQPALTRKNRPYRRENPCK
jgi:hypothetical protein